MKDRARRVARYYPVARVAHLERLAEMQPGEFLYTTTRRDWDDQLAADTRSVERVSFSDVLMRVARGTYATLEIPEPLALPLLPKLALLAVVEQARRALKLGRRTTFVFYAIENLDQTEKLRTVVRIPRWLARAAINVALGRVLAVSARAAFGTAGALDTYRSQLGTRRWSRLTQSTEVETFEALAPADPEAGTKDWAIAGFLGSFEERKGILELLSAWPRVRAAAPDANLVIIGHGPLQQQVEDYASLDKSVTVLIDPPRSEIRDSLRRWHVLTLPSRRTPVWREQIGLPILEGLSAGCEVVTTDETGIAQWLDRHGHTVVRAPVQPDELAASLIAALSARRHASEIQQSLPPVDGRILADSWLFSAHSPSPANVTSQ